MIGGIFHSPHYRTYLGKIIGRTPLIAKSIEGTGGEHDI
jgi:hypothetical protein